LFTAPSNLYDVGPNGQKFLFNVASSAVGTPKPLVVILNWTAELKRPD
jgi:hypothetical protein